MSAFDWFLVGWWLFSIVVAIAQVGKVRKPMEPPAVAIQVVIILALITGLLVSRGAFA